MSAGFILHGPYTSLYVLMLWSDGGITGEGSLLVNSPKFSCPSHLQEVKVVPY